MKLPDMPNPMNNSAPLTGSKSEQHKDAATGRRPYQTRRRSPLPVPLLLHALILSIGLSFAPASHAVDSPEEMLPDPALEAQARQIGQELRCLVCQNESIEESSTPLARDLRQIVRQQLQDGHGRKDIEHWMTARYGEFIRLRPVFSLSTSLLWLMPLLGLMLSLLLTYRLWHRPPGKPAPLTPAERRKLDSLLKKD